MERNETLIQTFCLAARRVSAVIARVGTMAEAARYAVDLCARLVPQRIPIQNGEPPVEEEATRPKGADAPRRLAAPGLSEKPQNELAALCRRSGVELVRENLREHLAGVEVGFTLADFGIAETGTLVIDSSSEEVRLATMICEAHVAVLPVDRLRPAALDLERELTEWFAAPPRFIAFVTGASRTADIERVLALGVHGPLELHILLLEEPSCNRPRI